MDRACHRARLVGADGAEAVSLHGLRHTAVSVMLGERVPITVVAAQLGHADPAITGRIYAHLTDESDLDLAVAAFERPHGGRRAVRLVEEPHSET